MAYVITGTCINDGACAFVCPVNSIHPLPKSTDFTGADMLYINPETCVNCNACLEACPVDAIMRATDLPPELERYKEINASYYLAKQNNKGG